MTDEHTKENTPTDVGGLTPHERETMRAALLRYVESKPLIAQYPVGDTLHESIQS